MNAVLTWGDLWSYIAVFLVIYYIGVLLLFYRKEIPAVMAGKSRITPASRTTATTENALTAENDAGLFNVVHELMEDCKPVFQAAVEQGLDKEQVLAALQVRIERYPQVRGTSFQIAVTNHIEQELQHRCNMTLDDMDLESLWK